MMQQSSSHSQSSKRLHIIILNFTNIILSIKAYIFICLMFSLLSSFFYSSVSTADQKHPLTKGNEAKQRTMTLY